MTPETKRALAIPGMILGGIFTLIFGSSLLSQDTATPAVWVLCAISAGAATWCYFVYQRGATSVSGDRLAQMEAEALAWLKAGQEDRLKPLSIPGLVTKRGESAMLTEYTQISEMVTRRTSRYAGTRINVGKLPLYFGGSESFSWKELRATDSGQLVITTHNIVFMGSQKTLKFPLSKIITTSPSMDALTISVEGRQTPVVFALNNPLVWSAAIQVFAGDKT